MKADPIERLWRSARKLRVKRSAAKSLPPLLFFSDPARTPNIQNVIKGLPRGSGVVFRAFGAADARLCGAALARLARRGGIIFIVGADARLAVDLLADGLHFPERMLDRKGDIRRLRRRFLITVAAHGFPAALRAHRAGVDAIVISSVFASRSPTARKPMGTLAFAALVRRLGTPVYGLGGINAENAPRLGGSGAIGLAAVESLAG